MGVPEKYELLELMAENETRTFRAREVSSGRPVMVHQLLAGPNRISLLELVLRARMSAAQPGESQIPDLGEHDGMPYVVTEMLPGFRTLREWLHSKLAQPEGAKPAAEYSQAGKWRVPTFDEAGARPPVPEPPSPAAGPPPGPAIPEPLLPPPPPSGREPGEFTRLYRAVMTETQRGPAQPRPESAPPPPPPAAVPPPAGRPPEVPKQPPIPGEFTRMFSSPSAPAGPPPAPAEPDEFARFFQSPLAGSPPGEPAIPPAPTPPAPAGGEPGEFTRLFQSPMAPEPPAAGAPGGMPASGLTPPFEPEGFVPPAAPASPFPPQEFGPPAPALPAQAGEFTRIFGGPAGRPEPVAPAGPAAGGATQIFTAPTAPPAEPAGPAAPEEPGDFTRIVGGPPAAAPGVPPPQQAAAPQPAAAPPARQATASYLPLFLILGCVFVAALVLILYFALKH